ncbi:MAG: hypothetical protein R3F56_10825 [Planctomycetota bacterium]
MNVLRSLRHPARLCLLSLAGAGCDHSGRPPQARPGVILELDGVDVHESELEPLLTFVRESGDRPGLDLARQLVLDQHVLPLRFAQRAFASERAALRERAEAMRRSVMASGGADPQLRAKGAIAGGEASPGLIGRGGMELAQAAWCFDPDNFGLVSPVVEVPRGFCLLSFSDHRPGIERSGDLVDAYQVPFYTHDKGTFETWWKTQQLALAGKLTYVHPAYVDALPPWLKR